RAPRHLLGVSASGDWLQRATRWRTSGLLQPPVGQQDHGVELGSARRKFLRMGTQAQLDPSQLLQYYRTRRRHRPGHPGPAIATPAAASLSSIAALLPVGPLRIAANQVATLR